MNLPNDSCLSASLEASVGGKTRLFAHLCSMHPSPFITCQALCKILVQHERQDSFYWELTVQSAIQKVS
jgi:hypothetical protein